MAEFVVRSKVADLVKSKGMHMAGDAVDGLDKVVKELVEKACERCNGSKRKTVQGFDF